jgi:hypothetical protein
MLEYYRLGFMKLVAKIEDLTGKDIEDTHTGLMANYDSIKTDERQMRKLYNDMCKIVDSLEFD